MKDVRLYELIALLAGVLLLVQRAGGRLAPRMVFAPLVFLVTRKPVMIAWAVGSVGMLLLIVLSAKANGKDPFANIPLLVGLCLFCGGGLAPLTVGPAFMILRARVPAPVLALEPGERLVEEIAANHFLGGEARGGKLLLTDRRVAFRPHRFNVQLDTWSARLDDVLGVRTEGTRMVLVTTRDGAEAWFVAMSPRDVAAKIESRARPGAETPGAVG